MCFSGLLDDARTRITIENRWRQFGHRAIGNVCEYEAVIFATVSMRVRAIPNRSLRIRLGQATFFELPSSRLVGSF
jgi:hypothetical protein